MNHLSIRRVLAVVGLLCATATTPQPADANLWKKAKKGVKDAGKAVSKESNKVGKAVDDAVEEVDDEIKKMNQAINKNFDKALREAERGYNQSVAFVNKTLTAAERAAYEAAAQAFYDENAAFIRDVTQRAVELSNDDKEFATRLDRMVTKSVNRQIDAQFRSDLQWLCEQVIGPFEQKKAELPILPMPKAWRLDDELDRVQPVRGQPLADVVFASSGSRPSKPKWLRSMTLTLTGGGGYVGGVEAGFGGVTDVYTKNGTVDARGLLQADGMLGAIKGASAGIILGFWPTPAAEADGASFGVMLAGAKKLGGSIEVAWSFTDQSKVHPTPGFAVGVIAGAGVEAGFVGGWETTFR